MKPKMWDVVVIGGGPAGMFASGRAGEKGAEVLLIEKNKDLGKKLLLTGGGRCNVTNAEFDNRKLLERFDKDGKFLFSTFSKFNVKDTLDFFESRGMKTKVEAEKRVFPVSNSSQSVLDVLTQYLKDSNVKVLKNSPVKEIKKSGEKIKSVILGNGDEVFAKNFVIATGGLAYPETGSTGDGFEWLSKLGHTIIPPDSALVPIIVKDKWVKDLQGITLQNIKISLFQNGKKIKSSSTRLGVNKILFTHFGVTGPTILNMSKKINDLLKNGEVFISVDLVPHHDFSSLNLDLQKLFELSKNRKIKNSLSELIPNALIPVVLQKSEIDENKYNHSVTKEERVKLMHVLKDLQMKVDDLMSPDKAIVSSGGVKLTEVNFKTMQSKLFSNLYLTGDILNINRPSGGFSLQLCWTTGFVAGDSI